jgi:hypothetical protein
MHGLKKVSNIDYHGDWQNMTMNLVTRVNWLRAKARSKRWKEEVLILQHEMVWTQMWFEHQQKVWEGRMKGALDTSKVGHHAYAAKQARVWRRFKEHACTEFEKVGRIVVQN